MKWQKHAFASITLATRKRQSTLSMGTLRLLLSAVAFTALCFSFADMASCPDGDGLQQGGHGAGTCHQAPL